MEKSRITNSTCNGKCSCCGECCTMFVPVTKKEVKIIKEYVEKNNIKPKEIRVTPEGFYEKCCFLNKDNKCMIYEVRPFVCRDFKCNHKDWKERKLKYIKRADYNGEIKKSKVSTFDELIYREIGPFMMIVNGMMKENTVSELYRVLKFFNRLDILEYMELTDDKGEKISGKEVIKEEENKNGNR